MRRGEGSADETGGRDRHGHRFLDRQQHPGGACLAAGRQVRHRRAPRNMPSSASAARCTASRSSTGRRMVPRKPSRFMEAGVGWNYIAMDQAIRDAGLEAGDVVNERTGIIMGSGGPSTRAIVARRRRRRARRTPRRSARSRCRRACARALRRRWRPPSRSRAPTIRSPRPARPRRTASATPPR